MPGPLSCPRFADGLLGRCAAPSPSGPGRVRGPSSLQGLSQRLCPDARARRWHRGDPVWTALRDGLSVSFPRPAGLHLGQGRRVGLRGLRAGTSPWTRQVTWAWGSQPATHTLGMWALLSHAPRLTCGLREGPCPLQPGQAPASLAQRPRGDPEFMSCFCSQSVLRCRPPLGS